MRKLAIYAAGSLVALTALTGLAHTRAGLRALAWVTGSDGCPFGAGEAMTAERAEALRAEAVATQVRAAQPAHAAPARPALGFQLDRHQRGDVLRWAGAHGVSCASDRSGAGLRCLDVAFADLPSALAPAGATAARGVVSFGFQPDGHLVSVQLQSATGTARPVLTALATSAMGELEALSPGATRGDALDSERFVSRQARAVFSDYVAEVTATSLGQRWTLVQTYQSPGAAPPAAPLAAR